MSEEANSPCEGCSGALTPQLYSRRKFFMALSFATGGAAATAVAVPLACFVVGPLFESSPAEWRKVGNVREFEVPWAGVTAGTAAWLHRLSETEFQAFSVNCTHLGCPVRWLPDAELFMCPCHGGIYYKNGDVAAGPPPKPLQQYKVRILKDEVQVQTGPIPITTA
jgi:menaquinol-cytochrome c reductase iron-sulfur subunit